MLARLATFLRPPSGPTRAGIKGSKQDGVRPARYGYHSQEPSVADGEAASRGDLKRLAGSDIEFVRNPPGPFD